VSRPCGSPGAALTSEGHPFALVPGFSAERVIPRLWALWWDYMLDLCATSTALQCFNPADGAVVTR
jgi:hypothetical protein